MALYKLSSIFFYFSRDTFVLEIKSTTELAAPDKILLNELVQNYDYSSQMHRL